MHARLRYANITVKDELYIYSLKTKGVGILNSEITQTDRVNRQNAMQPQKTSPQLRLPAVALKRNILRRGFGFFIFISKIFVFIHKSLKYHVHIKLQV